MGDEFVDLQVAVEVVLNKAWKLSATLHTTKGTSLPHTASDELESYLKRVSK